MLHRTEFVPETLPEGDFDLAYSFSVFTHISEAAAGACLGALHAALNPGGLLILTIRPPAYLDLDAKMHARARCAPARPADGASRAPLRLRAARRRSRAILNTTAAR